MQNAQQADGVGRGGEREKESESERRERREKNGCKARLRAQKKPFLLVQLQIFFYFFLIFAPASLNKSLIFKSLIDFRIHPDALLHLFTLLQGYAKQLLPSTLFPVRRKDVTSWGGGEKPRSAVTDDDDARARCAVLDGGQTRSGQRRLRLRLSCYFPA